MLTMLREIELALRLGRVYRSRSGNTSLAPDGVRWRRTCPTIPDLEPTEYRRTADESRLPSPTDSEGEAQSGQGCSALAAASDVDGSAAGA